MVQFRVSGDLVYHSNTIFEKRRRSEIHTDINETRDMVRFGNRNETFLCYDTVSSRLENKPGTTSGQVKREVICRQTEISAPQGHKCPGIRNSLQ